MWEATGNALTSSLPLGAGNLAIQDFLETCERAARVGGQVLQDWRGKFNVRSKGPKDVVSEADFAAQAAIREVLLGRYPDHDFLGEEDEDILVASKSNSAKRTRLRWIVDPLDGTANYVRALPAYAVSIALEADGEVVAGTVFDPSINECFTAALGKGAFLNGQRIQTSKCSQMSDAMVSASFAANVERGSKEVAQFTEMLYICQSLRRLGSAALNLAYVAAGRVDAYWSTSCKAWDVAAGILLIREAGGIVTNTNGQPFELAKPAFAATANAVLHREFLEILATSGS